MPEPRKCHYCDRVIVEGQHFIMLSMSLHTDMPDFMLCAPTTIDTASFCTIHCMAAGGYLFMKECAEDERTVDTFDPIHG